MCCADRLRLAPDRWGCTTTVMLQKGGAERFGDEKMLKLQKTKNLGSQGLQARNFTSRTSECAVPANSLGAFQLAQIGSYVTACHIHVTDSPPHDSLQFWAL